MDSSVQQRLDVASVSPLLIVAVTAAMFVAFWLIPRRRRFHVTIGFAMTWSLVGNLPELPGHVLAKGSLAGALLMVSLAALLHPGRRLRLSPVVLWWPILACFAVMFVLYVDNVLYALVVRAQWILLTITALLTCRSVTTREAADALARAIGVGLVIGVAIAASAIVVNGAGAFHIGRFSPYGANANVIGVVFAGAAPFSLYAAMRARYRITRWAMGGSTALVVGMLIMTASRTAIAVTGICLVPFLLSGLRRSLVIASVVGLAVMVILPFAYQPDIKMDQSNEQYGLSRLDSLETERYEIFSRYLDESISKRPLTGLLGVAEQSVQKDDEIGKHPHNAYLDMMYLGGILYTLPMLFLVILTIAAAVRVFIGRKQLPIDPLLASIFVFMLAAVYVHAGFGESGWYPTSAWAFLHVVLSCYVLTASNWLQRTARARKARPRRGQLVVVSGVVALLVAACSCGGGKGNKEVEQPHGDGGLQHSASTTPPAAGQEPRERAGGRGKPHWNWKNKALPEDATPRPIEVLNHLEVDRSASIPELLCAVKLEAPGDGHELRKKARDLKVPMMVLAYHVIDWRKDGVFDERDKERFGKWIDINIRPDSRQLVALDYEHPYWPELRRKDTTPERLGEIAAVYREILAFAKSRRPKVRWGFFGLPHRNYRLGEPWQKRLAQINEQILRHQDVVFTSIYDLGPGDRNGRDFEATRKFIELTLQAVGDRPVYAFVRGRYLGRSEMRDEPIPDAEFKGQVGAALDARWNDGKREHKLAGVILWDSKHDKRARPSPAEDLFRLYARQLGTLHDLIRAKRGRPAGGAPAATR